MRITDELIAYIEELSRLELSSEEKERAKKDLTDILSYMDKLSELDTTGAKEMTHPFDAANRFREEDGINGDERGAMLKNAPDARDGYFKVFKTVE